MRRIKRSLQQAVVFCWLVLVSLFMFKLWYTILWVILFALIMTVAQRKRSYCANVCPIGYFQDRMYQPKKQPRLTKAKPWLKRVVLFLFWAYLLVSIALYYSKPALLWVLMLQVMVFSLIVAITLQSTFRKRFWCSQLCPVGTTLHGVVRLSHRKLVSQRKLF